MTTPASPVTAVSGFTILEVPDTWPQVIPLYTVQSAAPERIETVYMTINIGTTDTENDVYAIQLTDQAGNQLYQQPTPLLSYTAANDSFLFLTFSRLGNDTGQLPLVMQLSGVDSNVRVWCNMRLPDLVLGTGSTVNLLSYRDNGEESADIVVSDATVTVTRNAGAVSDTTAVTDILPLLVPTTG